MLNVDKNNFESMVENLSNKHRTFVIGKKRSTNSLYINNRMVMINKNGRETLKYNKEQFRKLVTLSGLVKKQINTFLKNNEFNFDNVQQLHNSTITDKYKWESLVVAEVFYYIDINHCFWRIAFLKGYITSKLYSNALTDSDYYKSRNICLSLMVAPQTMRYYKHGKFLLEISEEKTMYQTIYNNIRFTSYNLMGEVMVLSKKNFIGYRTDGVMITKGALEDVCSFISDKGFNYSIKECCKASDTHYFNGEDLKKF